MKGILKKAMAAALVAVMVLSMSGCTEEEQLFRRKTTPSMSA